VEGEMRTIFFVLEAIRASDGRVIDKGLTLIRLGDNEFLGESVVAEVWEVICDLPDFPLHASFTHDDFEALLSTGSIITSGELEVRMKGSTFGKGFNGPDSRRDSNDYPWMGEETDWR
jgi:hypothetical protein